MKKLKIGDRVVRSKGDYVVGRTGVVIDEKTTLILNMNNTIKKASERVQVDWDGESTTWVSVDSVELESIPYKIQRFTDADRNRKTGRMPYPKYHKL